MAKIYLDKVINSKELRTEKRYDCFKGTDGNMYANLWTIDRKIDGNMQMCGAKINGKVVCLDGSLPTEVDKLPRGSKRVPESTAEKLWKSNSHYFALEDPKGF